MTHTLDTLVSMDMYKRHIRPLGVRPLIYPERVPKPWGFFYAFFPASRKLA